jgi:beta-N-acetylhexosaminidase
LLLGERVQDVKSLRYAMERLFEQGFINVPIQIDELDYYSFQNLQDKAWQEIIELYDYIIAVSKIFAFEQDKLAWQIPIIETVIKTANKQNKNLILISAALPYDIAYYTLAQTILACYGSPKPTNNVAMSALEDMPNIPATIDVIFGLVKPQGKLPVAIPKVNSKTLNLSDQILFYQGYAIDY